MRNGALKLIRLVSTLTILGVVGQANIYQAPAGDTAKPSKVLLGVFAHPDDETVCAGVLARAAASGWEVRVIFATSGDAGSDVSGRNLKGAALGKEREREGANALTALGVNLPPTFLGFGDGTVAQSRLLVKERLVKELGGLKPDVIVTFGPDGFTGHADHIAVGKATDEAAKEIKPACAVYHAVLGKQLEGWAAVAGVASLDCHKTQWTPEIQEKLRDFRRAYPFEEFVWSGGGLGAPGKWVGP